MKSKTFVPIGEIDQFARGLTNAAWGAVLDWDGVADFSEHEPVVLDELAELCGGTTDGLRRTIVLLRSHLDHVRTVVLARGCWRVLVDLARALHAAGTINYPDAKFDSLFDLGLIENSHNVNGFGHAVLERHRRKR